MTRRVSSVVMLLVGSALLAAGFTSDKPRNGGTFRIGHSGDLSVIDYALTSSAGETSEIASLTCIYPLSYADAPQLRIVPEAARSWKVSRDGRTYTFTIRKGLRFSNGEQVTARTFVATINRSLAVGLYAAAQMADIAGAEDVFEKRAKTASGVRAVGNRLVITTTDRAPDFPIRTTTPGFCAMPEGLPIDPEGARAPLPQAGPYYVASWTQGRRLVLKRNPRYGGRRPQHVDQYVIEYNLDPASIASRIQDGTLDTGDLVASDNGRLGRRYGVNHSRFYVKSTPVIFHARLNDRRPLFADVRMRRAVNLAIERTGLVRAAARITGGRPGGPYWGSATDQWLTPGMPGYRNARIYPFRPSMARARSLVRRHRGSRRASIYVRSEQPFLTWAQIARRDLRRIGIAATVHAFPRSVLDQRLDRPGEPWDLAFEGAYGPDYADPASALALFTDPPIPARYRRLYRRAESLSGARRYRLFGKLDVLLARDVAPTIPFAALNLQTFVSARVGCKILNPGLDLAAACLKR